MDFYLAVFELIDLRSFSNLWFWIMLAVIWSALSHFVIGVPYDIVARASRYGGQAEADMMDLVRINSNRFTYIADVAGSWLIGLTFFMLTGLFVLGFVYNAEICQALFLIITPMSLVFGLSVFTSRRIVGLTPDQTRKMMRKHRILTQLLGVLSILVTSMWGMYVNLSIGVLGG